MSKPTATLSPLQHRGAQQIKVEINFKDKELLKKIPSCKFSRTHRCFYIPYSKESYKQLRELFSVNTKEGVIKSKSTSPPSVPPTTTKEDTVIKLEKENDNRMKAFVPPHQKEWIQKIKTIPGRAWNEQQKYWSLPIAQHTFRFLEEQFSDKLDISFQPPKDMPLQYIPKNWTAKREKQPAKKPVPSHVAKPRFVEIEKDGKKHKMVVGDLLIVESENGHLLRAYVPNDKKDWLSLIRNIPGRRWNPEGKYWLLPFVKKTISYLKRHIGNRAVFNVSIPDSLQEDFPDTATYKRTTPRLPDEPLKAFHQEAINEMENQLRLEGKEHTTIKSYRGHLRRFFRFYSKVKPKEISAEQIRS